MAFSDKLKKLRMKKGMKQSELADILHLRQSSISDYENNRSTPNPETIKKIAEYFNVSANYLLDMKILFYLWEKMEILTKKLHVF